MKDHTRTWTRRLLEEINEGILDANTVLLAALDALSEDDVRDMCEANGWFDTEEDEDSEDEDSEDISGEHIDNPNWVGSRHHY